MKENNKISIVDNLLVDSGKSSRLAAMLNKPRLSKNTNNNTRQLLSDGLKPEIKVALQEAGKLIEERLEIIKNTYPAGKKSTFFRIKHGVEEAQIKLMPMKKVFTLLSLDTAKIRHFRMIENIDYSGRTVW